MSPPRCCAMLPVSSRLLEIVETMVWMSGQAEKYFRYVDRYIGCIGRDRPGVAGFGIYPDGAIAGRQIRGAAAATDAAMRQSGLARSDHNLDTPGRIRQLRLDRWGLTMRRGTGSRRPSDNQGNITDSHGVTLWSEMWTLEN